MGEPDNAYKDLAWKHGNIHLSAPCILRGDGGPQTAAGTFFPQSGQWDWLPEHNGWPHHSSASGLGVNHGVELHTDVVEYAREKLEDFIKIVTALISLRVQKDHENYMKVLLKIGGILVMPIEDQLTQITRTGQCSWESKNILAVSFAPLVQQSRADGEKPDTVELPSLTVRSLQDLSRVYIRRTLRTWTARTVRGRRRCREFPRSANAGAASGDASTPTFLDIGDIEILKQANTLRDQIMALPLPESLKAYLLFYREK
ncbi:hypothetical protein KUCAC02_018684 [Chaenocephalus aceratus]|uniref:Uncharacterized protein n=1 Tax=Chaenocephalus aceratus TaxID=36190 RepID=A0ACB9W967_CHAAC|nr:hypothetical protein KUCAC02_018684 [Chaenocephalus aceratus]